MFFPFCDDAFLVSCISYFCSTWFFRDTARHVEQLVVFGGFTDTHFLERSLVKQFNELQDRWIILSLRNLYQLYVPPLLEIDILSIGIIFIKIVFIWTFSILSVKVCIVTFHRVNNFRYFTYFVNKTDPYLLLSIVYATFVIYFVIHFSLKDAFLMPFTTISSKVHCQGLLPLYPVTLSDTLSSACTPTSISFYKVLVLSSDFLTKFASWSWSKS